VDTLETSLDGTEEHRLEACAWSLAILSRCLFVLIDRPTCS
jgi:hypothetical protein